MIKNLKRLKVLAQSFSKKDYLSLVSGIILGTVWFIYTVSFDLNHRVRGDALEYLKIADHFQSWNDAFTYIGARTIGFPFFLYCLKSLTQIVSTSWSIEQFVNFSCTVLLIFHWSSVFLFWISIRRAEAAKLWKLRIPSMGFFLILIHPGLIAHVGVPLTDTFGADLILIAASLILLNETSPFHLRKGGILYLSGAILGYSILVRPFYMIGIFLALFFYLLFDRTPFKQRFFQITFIGLGLMTLLGPVLWNCSSTYSQVCLQDPKFGSESTFLSIQLGLSEIRHYWSIFSKHPETLVSVHDPFLEKYFSSQCTKVESIAGENSLIVCFLERAHWIPVYFLKKSAALFDHYQLQPYAVDLAPRWLRLYSRVFGGICFSGFIGIILYLSKSLLTCFHRVKLNSNDYFFPLLPLWIPTGIVLSHSIMHIEARYSFSAVPFTLLAFVTWIQASRAAPTKVRIYYFSLIGLSLLFFYYEVFSWDLLDPVLSIIEQKNS